MHQRRAHTKTKKDHTHKQQQPPPNATERRNVIVRNQTDGSDSWSREPVAQPTHTYIHTKHTPKRRSKKKKKTDCISRETAIRHQIVRFTASRDTIHSRHVIIASSNNLNCIFSLRLRLIFLRPLLATKRFTFFSPSFSVCIEMSISISFKQLHKLFLLRWWINSSAFKLLAPSERTEGLLWRCLFYYILSSPMCFIFSFVPTNGKQKRKNPSPSSKLVDYLNSASLIHVTLH